ncbi:MAG: efflux transporter permease subunit [Ferruginibacter sp.]|nr:efflux transporter permease subunit [Ferruginibacter sp.]
MKNFFTAYKSPVAVVLALIIAGGIMSYKNLQTSLFPEISFPKIKIIADAGLQPVDKMLVTVTKPLEAAIKQVPDLTQIRSTTSRGSCEISAFIDWKSDIDLSQQRIESKINQLKSSLPPDLQVTVEKMNPSILPVMGFSLESHNKSPIELKKLALLTIKPFLSQVQGIADVRIIGGKDKEYWITLDPQKMSTLSLTPDLVSAALSQTNFIRSNGFLSDYKYLYLSITDATVHTIDELQHTVISNNGQRVVELKDIADVQVRDAIEYIKINANGHDGILVAIIKQPNANLITVADEVNKKIVDLRPLLPEGVSIKPYYNQADFVQDAVNSVTDSLWIGLALAIIVAIIFLRSFRASLTILITIPITLALTLIVIYFAGYSFNIMTLGAIAAAIGLIIDDAIVVMEQIHRSHEEHPDEPTTVVVQKAVHYLFPAMLGSSISTIVIFIPFVLMSGVAGAYFKVMTDTMIITLICSFIVTWLGLPVVYLLLSKKENPDEQKKHKAAATVKRPWISYFIHQPVISFIFIAVLIVSIVLILPRLETGFLPEMDEGSIVLDYASPPGTSLAETDRILRQVEKIVTAVPEVEAYSRRTGTQMGFFITEPNTGDYLIQLKKSRKRSSDEVINEIRSKIEASQTALQVDFGQVMGDMLGDLMNSVQPIEIKIFGNDATKLHELSQQVSGLVEKVPGAADVFDGIVIAGPSMRIRPMPARLAQFGLTAENLQMQLQTAMQGSLINGIAEKETVSGIRLAYPGSRNMSREELGKLPVFLPGGKLKLLSELAEIDINPGDAQVERENLQTMGVVTARLEQGGLGSVMKSIQADISKQIVLPPGYYIEYGGAYAEQQRSFHELLMILVSSSLLVFGVILFLFRDVKIAFLILCIALLGIAGSYLALFFTGTALNVGSYTGLIMIVGIIGENAIFTFLQYQETRQTAEVDEALVYAISTRLRPKLMTALGAIIALMPLALGIGTGAQLHQPLAIAVIGGFVVALPLLLIVFPTMIRMLYHKKTKTFPASTQPQ